MPSAACFVLGLLNWRRPWRVGQLDLLALAGFFPVAMLLSDDDSEFGLCLAAACLGWLCCRMAGAALGLWRLPELRPAVSSRWLWLAIVILLLVRIGSLPGGNILDVGQASSLGAWRLLHGLRLYGEVSWPGPSGLQVYRPDSYGPFAYYAYLLFAALFPPAPAQIATLLPALCFDALTIAGLHRLGRRLGGRPLAQAFVFAYLLYPFPDLSLMAETNDALIAALCVWAIVATAERPAARGLLMAAAALTKFLPALLALQFLGMRRGRWRYALTLVASLAAMLAWPLITSGPALAAALLLLALSPLLRPRVLRPGAPRPVARGAREEAALAAALLIGGQLLLGYWFYSYLTWFYPLLVIAMMQASGPDPHPGPAAPHAYAAAPDRRHSGMARDRDGTISTSMNRTVVPSSVPEVAPFPAGLNDCVSGLKWVIANAARLAIDPGRVIVAGESGGGNLTLATGLKLKQDGELGLISGLYAMAPFIKGEWPTPDCPSSTENNGIFMDVHTNRATVGYGIEAFTERNPLAWPSFATAADVEGFPPVVISVNECDPLRDEGVNFYRLLLAAGVPARCRQVMGTMHAVETYTAVCPEISRDTARDLAAFCRG